MKNRKDIQSIDKKITALQSSLFDLYRQRQELFSGEVNYPNALRAATTVAVGSAENWYNTLRDEWKAREVTVPRKPQLLPRIKAGLVTIEQLAYAYGVSPDVFTLILIPPTTEYNDKELDHDRLMQTQVRYKDHFDVHVKHAKATDWRLLAVYDGLEGIDMGSAHEIILSQSYSVNGLDTRALGTREYQIYALRHNGNRDTAWTWLLKETDNEAWSVKFMSGAYHFTKDDMRGLGQGELFRPAVEIM